MKKFTNSRALSGLRKPHRNSLPGPVRDTAKRTGEAMRKIFANVFSGRSDLFFFMTKASVVSVLLAPRILARVKPLLRRAETRSDFQNFRAQEVLPILRPGVVDGDDHM